MMTALLIVLCALTGAVFSGAEAGLLCVNRVRLRHRVKHRDRAAARLQRLLRHPGRMLLTVTLVANLAHIAVLALAVHALGYAVAFLIFAPLYLFGLELLPKAVFRRLPTDALSRLAAPLRLIYLALAPLFRLGEDIARGLFPPAEAEKLAAAREDFKHAATESERSGAITAAQRRLIDGVVDFRHVSARELMQPLAKFPTVNEARLYDDREHFLLKTGGAPAVVSLFETLMTGSAPRPLASIAVAADEPAFQVLAQLRASRCGVAIVTEGERPVGVLLIRLLYRRLLAGA